MAAVNGIMSWHSKGVVVLPVQQPAYCADMVRGAESTASLVWCASPLVARLC